MPGLYVFSKGAKIFLRVTKKKLEYLPVTVQVVCLMMAMQMETCIRMLE
jgi:hypothetical protein